MSLLNIAIASLVVGLIGLTASAMQNGTREESSAGTSARAGYQPLTQGLTLEDVQSNLEGALFAEYRKHLEVFRGNLAGYHFVNELTSLLLQAERLALMRRDEKRAKAMAEASARFVLKPQRQDLNLNDVESHLGANELARFRDMLYSLHVHENPGTVPEEEAERYLRMFPNQHLLKGTVQGIEEKIFNEKQNSETQPPTLPGGGDAN